MVLQNLKVNQVKFAKTKEVCEESIERYKASVKDQIAQTNKEKSDLEGKVDEFGSKFDEIAQRQKVVEEQMFSKLWEEDRLAKERREAKEERRQKELVENTRLGLNAQVTSIQAQRQAAQRLKEEEALLVVGLFQTPVVEW
jgi:predicted unusual protein kinase regulating ubiquinone biosynthesis (AarF/ABC1/UbiB family)